MRTRPEYTAVRVANGGPFGAAMWRAGVVLRWDSTRGAYIGPGGMLATADQVRRYWGRIFEAETQ